MTTPTRTEIDVVTDFQQALERFDALAAAEGELRRRTNESWMARGVTMLDPSHTYIDATIHNVRVLVTAWGGTNLPLPKDLTQ